MARSGIPLPDIEHLLRRGGRPIPLLDGLLVAGVEEGLVRARSRSAASNRCFPCKAEA
jgi:hypothetical protein